MKNTGDRMTNRYDWKTAVKGGEINRERLSVQIVCRDFCDHYKGKGGEAECGGFSAVLRMMVSGTASIEQLEKVSGQTPLLPARIGLLTEKLCSRCGYYENFCDFHSPDPPDDATPCGGYRLIQALLVNGEIGEEDLNKVLSGLTSSI